VSRTAARRWLWLAALATMPVPFYLGEIEWAPVLRLGFLTSLLSLVLAAEGGRTLIWIAGLGIIQTAPATGPSQSCAVRCTGISKAIAGAAVTVGAQVYVGDTSGRLKVVPAAGATGVVTIGLALTPATAVGVTRGAAV